MTYRYSGVRLFAHPWMTPNEVSGQQVTEEIDAAEGTAAMDPPPGKVQPMELDKQEGGEDAPTVAAAAAAASSAADGAAVAWSSSPIAHPPSVVYPFRLLHALNEHMRAVTASALADLYTASADPPAARSPSGAAFNLTLINYLDPRTHALPLRTEPYYRMGPLAVGWHRDESLEDHSSIGVYHASEETDAAKQEATADQYWHVALKRAWDVDTPAVKVALKDGDAYVMAYDLNTTHQHAVLAGTGKRFSSTHRVARRDTDTIGHVAERIRHVRHAFSSATPAPSAAAAAASFAAAVTLPALDSLLSVSCELEFEWVRQFHLQGRRHARNHAYYWSPRVAWVEREWRWMQAQVARVFDRLANYGFSTRGPKALGPTATTTATPPTTTEEACSPSATAPALDLPICRALLSSFLDVQRLREQWASRYQQPAYYPTAQQKDDTFADETTPAEPGAEVDPHEDEPIERPVFDETSPMPYDLSGHIANLIEWQAEFEQYAADARAQQLRNNPKARARASTQRTNCKHTI